MFSESIVENLFIEIESISFRLNSISSTYIQTGNSFLMMRLNIEFDFLQSRVEEIYSIANFISASSEEELTLSYILMEKCSRTSKQTKELKNLFFV